MMNLLAFRIVSVIKKTAPEQTHSIEVMHYALSIILNTLSILIISLLIGSLTGQFKETLIALISFGCLRMCSGGAHLKTASACNITSILICSSIPHIAFHLHNYLFWMNLFSVVCMACFAPHPDRNAQLPKEWYLGLKLLSIMLVLANFWMYSSVIGLAFFIQSLTVIIPVQREVNR